METLITLIIVVVAALLSKKKKDRGAVLPEEKTTLPSSPWDDLIREIQSGRSDASPKGGEATSGGDRGEYAAEVSAEPATEAAAPAYYSRPAARDVSNRPEPYSRRSPPRRSPPPDGRSGSFRCGRFRGVGKAGADARNFRGRIRSEDGRAVHRSDASQVSGVLRVSSLLRKSASETMFFFECSGRCLVLVVRHGFLRFSGQGHVRYERSR